MSFRFGKQCIFQALDKKGEKMKEIIIIPEKSLDLIDVYNNKNRAERRKSKKSKKRLKKIKGE